MTSQADGAHGAPDHTEHKVSVQLSMPHKSRYAHNEEQGSPATGSGGSTHAAQGSKGNIRSSWIDPLIDPEGAALSHSRGGHTSHDSSSDMPTTAAAAAASTLNQTRPEGLHGPVRKQHGVSLAILKQLATHVEQIAAQHAQQSGNQQPVYDQQADEQSGGTQPAKAVTETMQNEQQHPEQHAVQDKPDQPSDSSNSINSTTLQQPALHAGSEPQGLRTTASEPLDMLPPSPFAVLPAYHRAGEALGKKKTKQLPSQRSVPDVMQHGLVPTNHAANTHASFDSFLAAHGLADAGTAQLPSWLQPEAVQHPATCSSNLKSNGGSSSNSSRSMGAQNAGQGEGSSPGETVTVQEDQQSDQGMPDDLLRDRSIIEPRYPSLQQKNGVEASTQVAQEHSPAALATVDANEKHDSKHTVADPSGFLLNPFASRHSSSSSRRYGSSGSKVHAQPAAQTQSNSNVAGEAHEGAEPNVDTIGGGFGGLLLTLHSGMHDDIGQDMGEDEAVEEGYEVDDEDAQEVDDEEGFEEEPAPDPYQMMQEINKLKEELSAQRSVAAGLRGELRKYTQLAAALEAQMLGLRQVQLSSSSASTTSGLALPTSQLLSVSSTAVNMHAQQAAAAKAAIAAAAAARDSSHSSNSSAADEDDKSEGGAAKGAGPGVDAGRRAILEGLEANKRLALYQEALSGNVSMATGSIKEELLAAEEVLKGKEHLDSGSEKVVLIKLQKIIQAGANAARTLELMQSDRTWGASHPGLYGALSTSVLPQSMFTSHTAGTELLPTASSEPLQGQTSVAVGPDTPETGAEGDHQRITPMDAAETQTDSSPEGKSRAAATAREWQLTAEVAQLMEENAALQRELAVLRAQLSPPAMISPFAIPQASSAAVAACGNSISSSSSTESSPTGHGTAASKPPRPNRLALLSSTSQRPGSRRSASAPNSPSRSSLSTSTPPAKSYARPPQAPSQQDAPSLPEPPQHNSMAQQDTMSSASQHSGSATPSAMPSASQHSGPSTPSGAAEHARMSDTLNSTVVELNSPPASAPSAAHASQQVANDSIASNQAVQEGGVGTVAIAPQDMHNVTTSVPTTPGQGNARSMPATSAGSGVHASMDAAGSVSEHQGPQGRQAAPESSNSKPPAGSSDHELSARRHVSSSAPLRLQLLHQLLTASDSKIEAWQQIVEPAVATSTGTMANTESAAVRPPAMSIVADDLQQRMAQLLQEVNRPQLPAAPGLQTAAAELPGAASQQSVFSTTPTSPASCGTAHTTAQADEPPNNSLVHSAAGQLPGDKVQESPPGTAVHGQQGGDATRLQAELAAKTAEAADLRCKVVQLAMRLDDLTAKQQAGSPQQRSASDVVPNSSRTLLQSPTRMGMDATSPAVSGSNSPRAAAAAAAAANSLIHLSAALTLGAASGSSPSRLSAGLPAAAAKISSSPYASSTAPTHQYSEARASQHAAAQRATSEPEPALVPAAHSFMCSSISSASQQEAAVITALEGVSDAAAAASKLLLSAPAATAAGSGAPQPAASPLQQAHVIASATNSGSAARTSAAPVTGTMAAQPPKGGERLPMSFAELYKHHLQHRYGP